MKPVGIVKSVRTIPSTKIRRCITIFLTSSWLKAYLRRFFKNLIRGRYSLSLCGAADGRGLQKVRFWLVFWKIESHAKSRPSVQSVLRQAPSVADSIRGVANSILGVVDSILEVDNVKGTIVMVGDVANTYQVTTTNDHDQMTVTELDEVLA